MTPTLLNDFLILLMAYLFGSIPFGLFLSWLFKLQDPRTMGSQSIGATNILRSGNKLAAGLTLLLDALKEVRPLLLPLSSTLALAHGRAFLPSLAIFGPSGFVSKAEKGWQQPLGLSSS